MLTIILSVVALLVAIGACFLSRPVVHESAPEKKYRLATYVSNYVGGYRHTDIEDRENAGYFGRTLVACTPWETLPTFMRRLLNAANVDLTLEPGQPATPAIVVIRKKGQENEKAAGLRHPLDPRGVSGDLSGS